MIVKAGGPRCGCGARGCLEALASKTAIARRVEKAVRKGLPTVLGEKMTRKGGRLKSRDLAEAVQAKDLVALKEVQRAAHFLGIALGSLINLSAPRSSSSAGAWPERSAIRTSSWSGPRPGPRRLPIRRERSSSIVRPSATTPGSWVLPCSPASISSRHLRPPVMPLLPPEPDRETRISATEMQSTMLGGSGPSESPAGR